MIRYACGGVGSLRFHVSTPLKNGVGALEAFFHFFLGSCRACKQCVSIKVRFPYTAFSVRLLFLFSSTHQRTRPGHLNHALFIRFESGFGRIDACVDWTWYPYSTQWNPCPFDTLRSGKVPPLHSWAGIQWLQLTRVYFDCGWSLLNHGVAEIKRLDLGSLNHLRKGA